MATALTIRQLDEDTHQRLRERAASRRRSVEAEVRAILTEAVQPASGAKDWRDGLRERALARTAGRPQTDSAELIAQGRDDR
jgi:plasmid stability protein